MFPGGKERRDQLLEMGTTEFISTHLFICISILYIYVQLTFT